MKPLKPLDPIYNLDSADAAETKINSPGEAGCPMELPGPEDAPEVIGRVTGYNWRLTLSIENDYRGGGPVALIQVEDNEGGAEGRCDEAHAGLMAALVGRWYRRFELARAEYRERIESASAKKAQS